MTAKNGWVYFSWSLACLCIIGAAIGAAPVTEQGRGADTWPPDGPTEFFGATWLPPEPDRCPVPSCPDVSYLGRFVHALDLASKTPTEIRDVLARAYTESRFTPTSVSETDDWGICQIHRPAWRDIDVDRLLVDPEYAAVECLRVYRVMVSRCGKDWQCCYRHGVNGCKSAAIDAASKE